MLAIVWKFIKWNTTEEGEEAKNPQTNQRVRKKDDQTKKEKGNKITHFTNNYNN